MFHGDPDSCFSKMTLSDYYEEDWSRSVGIMGYINKLHTALTGKQGHTVMAVAVVGSG